MNMTECNKIINEDAFDLLKKIGGVIDDYVHDYDFEHKEEAIVVMLGNLVGFYFSSFKSDNDRADALDVFITILQEHLNRG